MTKHYSGATKKRRSSGGMSRGVAKLIPTFSSWHSLILGLIMGAALTSLGFYTLSNPEITLKIPATSISTADLATPTIPKKDKVPERVASTSNVVKEPRFDFYSELTKNNHDSQQAKASLVTPAPSAEVKAPAKTISGYLVQAGSFKTRADADALKARLTLDGMNAKIEIAKLGDGKVWHRVMLGPFSSEKTALEHKRLLSNLSIDGILVFKYSDHNRG